MKRPGWGILIVILLGGWLLNVASGWVCELVPDQSNAYWSRTIPAADVAWWVRHAPADWPKRPNNAIRVSRVGTQSISMSHDTSSDVGVLHMVQRNRSGWPFVSMEGANWFEYPSNTTRLEARLSGSQGWQNLNLRPLWPGTIINTLFYALILLGVYYVLQALRRRRRIRRGKCPGCAYDLRGGGHANCPECGRAVTR